MRCSSADVGEPRHVVEDQRLLGQQARDHQRQRGVLRARDRNGAVEAVAADDANAIHYHPSRSTPDRPRLPPLAEKKAQFVMDRMRR